MKQPQQLSRLLATELKHTRQLLDILIEEHQALGQPDPDRITAISLKKLDCLKELERHHAKREQFLVDQGFSSGAAGMEALVQSLPGDTPVAGQWRELRGLAGKLKRQNEINGSIVALTQRHITLALDILTGRASTSPTYGRSGQTHGNAASQRLAKA